MYSDTNSALSEAHRRLLDAAVEQLDGQTIPAGVIIVERDEGCTTVDIVSWELSKRIAHELDASELLDELDEADTLPVLLIDGADVAGAMIPVDEGPPRPPPCGCTWRSRLVTVKVGR